MKNKKLFLSLILLFFMALLQGLVFVLPASVAVVYYNFIRPAAYAILLTFTLIYIGIDLGCSRRKKPANAVLLSGALIYAVMLLFTVSAASFRQNYAAPGAGVFLENAWRYIPIAAAGEILRFQILKSTDKKHKPLIFALAVMVFSFTMLENTGSAAADAAHWARYLAATLPPIVALNLFLTHVCRSGALVGTVSLRCACALTLVFAPLLTDIARIFLAILLCVTVIAMFLFYKKYADNKQKKRLRYRRDNTRWALYLTSVLIVTVCIVFGAGAFPFAPVAVASDSMKGAGADNFSRGDMLIIKKFEPDEAVKILQKGDIIVFRSGDKDIIHRIIEITHDFRGNTQYVTKGDSNNEADDYPVNPDQIMGVATAKVPFLGFPSVLLMRWIYHEKN